MADDVIVQGSGVGLPPVAGARLGQLNPLSAPVIQAPVRPRTSTFLGAARLVASEQYVPNLLEFGTNDQALHYFV